MQCLYVCIKEVIGQATGYDMPHYLEWPIGSVAWFDEPPDKNHWRELVQYTASDAVFTQKATP